MTYLSTAEVAEIKGCSLQYVQKCAKDGKISAEVKDTAANNRIEYQVPLSALSEREQLKWEAQQRQKLGLEPMIKPELKPIEKRRQIALSEFSSEQRDEIAFWSGVLQDWLSERDRNGDKFGKCKVDEMFVGAQKLKYPDISISVDILYRKYRAYKTGDLAALIDHRGGHNKGQSSIPKHAWDYFQFIYLNESRRTVSRSYAKTLEFMRVNYPEEYSEVPSERHSDVKLRRYRTAKRLLCVRERSSSTTIVCRM